jgi:DNA-binding NarL/FixJ family response regulator
MAAGDDGLEGSLAPTASYEDLAGALASPPALTVGEAPSRAGIERLATLTPRERTILGLLATGRDRNEIAAELDLSPNTVRTHAQHVYAKLRLHSAADLVRFASRHGLATTGPQNPSG